MKIDFNKEIFVLRFNWAAILAFVSFWSYGFFGALSSGNFGISANIIIALILCGVFVLFLWIWRKDSSYNDKIVLRVKDIFVFLSFLAVLFFLSFYNLIMSVGGDQLAHAQQSKLHSITLIEFLSDKTDFLNNFPFKWLIFVVDLLTIIAAFLSYKLLKHKNWFVKDSILIFLFLTFRFSIVALGGSAGLHPAFRLFPLWLSSAILTSSDFSFRFAQFLGLVGFVWLSQRFFNRRLNFFNSWLFALVVGTIPVLWHTGTLVEQSIWTAISWTLLLLYFYEAGDFNYIRWISIISIFSMLRQPAFVALIPIFSFLAIDFIKKRELGAKKLFLLASPIFVMLPFFLNSVVVGTPAIYSWEQSTLQKIWSALSLGIIFNAIGDSVRWYWILLIVPWLFIRKEPIRTVVVFIFLLAAVFIFYSIQPGLWGLGRYQAEYVVPFMILGLFMLVSYVVKYNFARRFLPLFLVVMMIYNIYVFRNLADFNKSKDNYTILSESPYEYRQAFREVRQTEYVGKVFVAGLTYGVFGEILNDFTVAEIKAEKEIYNELKPGFSAEEINRNNKIQLVLISDFASSEKLKNDLASLGWKKWKEFKNLEYGSTIFGLAR